MTKLELVDQLLEVCEDIRLSAEEYLGLQRRLAEQEFTLEDQEARLLTAPNSPIDGKNTEVRAAQMFGLTGPEHVLIMELKSQVAMKKAEIDYHGARHRSLIAAAALLAAGPDMDKPV